MRDIWGLVVPEVVGGACCREVLKRERLNCTSQEGFRHVGRGVAGELEASPLA
jgi:hypothetical protein